MCRDVLSLFGLQAPRPDFLMKSIWARTTTCCKDSELKTILLSKKMLYSLGEAPIVINSIWNSCFNVLSWAKVAREHPSSPCLRPKSAKSCGNRIANPRHRVKLWWHLFRLLNEGIMVKLWCCRLDSKLHTIDNLFMAGLFTGFLVEKCVACQNSVIRFRMASFSFFTLLNT